MAMGIGVMQDNSDDCVPLLGVNMESSDFQTNRGKKKLNEASRDEPFQFVKLSLAKSLRMAGTKGQRTKD